MGPFTSPLTGILFYGWKCGIPSEAYLSHPVRELSSLSSAQVERTLYRIHRSVLSRHSPFFRNLFSIAQPQDAKEAEGSSDEHPLHLPHILVEQFDAFLYTVYPR
jgi:hypothetical protein